MAAEFYFYKAFAEYVLFNESKIAGNADTTLLESSIRDNTKSFALSDKMYESVYNKAKALALLGKNEEAFEVNCFSILGTNFCIYDDICTEPKKTNETEEKYFIIQEKGKTLPINFYIELKE
ncbi:MAG: hypothetical protein J6Y16_02600 [Treponema sp.]|nr:hypothetical protein [Treponema sp.]